MEINQKKLWDFVQNNMEQSRILVVGDVMLDKYYYGDVTRISPEAPVPITHVTSTKETLGGAANVAHNLALLGCQTAIAGFVGDDYHCQSLLDKFTSRGIDYRGIIYTDAPTTTSSSSTRWGRIQARPTPRTTWTRRADKSDRDLKGPEAT